MQHVKYLKFGVAAVILSVGALLSARVSAQDVIAVADGNKWDGQWHFDATAYGWVPFLYTTVDLPAIAGGGSQTVETQPSQYLKYLQGAILVDGEIQKGDWGLWTDFVYMNLKASQSNTNVIGLPGGLDPGITVNRQLDVGVRAAIWTVAPSYTIVHNEVGSLDVMAGLRYSSFRVSMAYEFSLDRVPLNVGGGFWPVRDSTDGLVGVKGNILLSKDGKWFLPYVADVGDGNKNWQWEAFLGAGYRFGWGSVTLGVRNLTYRTTDNQIIEKLRMTGPILGATFHW